MEDDAVYTDVERPNKERKTDGQRTHERDVYGPSATSADDIAETILAFPFATYMAYYKTTCQALPCRHSTTESPVTDNDVKLQ